MQLSMKIVREAGFLIFCCVLLEISASSISDDFARLPKIFYLNVSEQCPDENYYCKVNIKLKPKDVGNPPESWELMEKRQFVYKKGHIYRALCVAKDESIEQKVNEELVEYNLTGDVYYSYCDHKLSYTKVAGLAETLFCMFFISCLGFTIYCTAKTHASSSRASIYEKMFSFTNTWKEIRNPKRNEDYENLKSIQGMRTFGIISVIGVHTVLVRMFTMFVKNPEYFEDIPNSSAKSLINNSFGLVVQIFFVISAWLLAVRLQNIVKKNGEFTWKDMLLLWLNRYLRFLPIVLVLLFSYNLDGLAVFISHPYFYSVVRPEVETCRKNWWKNVFFIQNIYTEDQKMCAPGMWYIAADLQMYIIVSALFYISRRFRIPMKSCLGSLTLLSVCFQLFRVFTTDFNGLVRFTPGLLLAEDAFYQPEVVISYFHIYGNCVTYIIGFAFGTIYWHNKKTAIFNTWMKKLAFYVAFLGLPILASYLYGLRSNRALEALLSISLRPMFSLGIAIGLLGMVTGSGGFVKKIFESAPMEFFGSFTYSIYMFHFINVFGRGSFWAQYEEVGDLYLLVNWIIDITISFINGTLMYILLEHPFVKLQKQLVPQINMGTKKTL